MSVYLDDGDVVLHLGDALDVLRAMPGGSVDCCVTSPPYFGLRDYGVDGQIGLEDTPEAYIARLVDVFAEVRRVLADHGTVFLNLGDSYAGVTEVNGGRHDSGSGRPYGAEGAGGGKRQQGIRLGAKPKDLLMMPARVALALQANGWWLRSDIIWSKPNPMPESVRDRPTSAHEHIFLLTKAPRYYWDAEAVREPGQDWSKGGPGTGILPTDHYGVDNDGNGGLASLAERYKKGDVAPGRNVRNVWTMATEPTPNAHFATFPSELVRRCLAAGCPERVCATCGVPSERVVETDAPGKRVHGTRPGRVAMRDGWMPQSAIPEDRSRTTTGWTDCGHDAYRPGVVLDPFIGSGTTAKVARSMGLRAVGIDLNPDYLAIAARRLQQLSLLGGAS